MSKKMSKNKFINKLNAMNLECWVKGEWIFKYLKSELDELRMNAESYDEAKLDAKVYKIIINVFV